MIHRLDISAFPDPPAPPSVIAMHPHVIAALWRPPYLLTRKTAVEAGMTPEAVDRVVREGTWVAVRRGIYAERAYVDTLVTRAERQRLHDDAAALATRIEHVRSHESAAVVWKMPVLLPARPTAHLTVPIPPNARNIPQRSRHRAGAKHHLAPYDDHDAPTVVDGVPVLGRARTAADVTREHGLVAGVVAMDSALRAGATLADLAAVPTRMQNWPFVTIVEQAIDLADTGSESVGESLNRLLVESLGRGRPQSQFGLSRGGRTAFVDLRLGRHFFEFDGKSKYLRGVTDGIAPEDVLWEEKKRQDWLGGFKTGMSRLTWSDVWPFGQREVLARLEQEIEDTNRRFGTDIGDLAPFIVERRPRRPAA